MDGRRALTLVLAGFLFAQGIMFALVKLANEPVPAGNAIEAIYRWVSP